VSSDSDRAWELIGDVCRRQQMPLERIRGEWLVRLNPSAEPCVDDEPEAIVVWADEPSPETGHEGWTWWARGRMGEARTAKAAMDAADAALARKRPE
jgi:hypothetical protein